MRVSSSSGESVTVILVPHVYETAAHDWIINAKSVRVILVPHVYETAQGLTLTFWPTCPFGQVPYWFYLPETVNY